MEGQVTNHNVQGERRPDGSFIGYDYATGQWIDTDPAAKRDPEFLPGMASNPLPSIPTA